MLGGKRKHPYPSREAVNAAFEMRDGHLFWRCSGKPAGYYKQTGAHVVRYKQVEFLYADLLCIWFGVPLPPRMSGRRPRGKAPQSHEPSEGPAVAPRDERRQG